MGYEKFIMDVDFLGAMHTYVKGLPIEDDHLGLDAFKEVGIGKHFFGCSHTMRHYETAFWDSGIADNTSYEQWRDAGEWDTVTRANDTWKKMLAAYELPAMDQSIDDALTDYMAKKKESMPDAWY